MSDEQEEVPTEEMIRDNATLNKHMALLREHFDTVQIFVTRDEGTKRGTVAARAGCGDVFARYGHVKFWIDQMEQGGMQDL